MCVGGGGGGVVEAGVVGGGGGGGGGLVTTGFILFIYSYMLLSWVSGVLPRKILNF